MNKPGNRRLKLEGEKFGRLTVLGFHDIRTRKGNKRESRWLCKCDCGNEVILVGSKIKSGHTQSCGCLNKEITIKASTTHGLSHEKLYFVWKAMIARCQNENNPNYHHYGGRGIKVCKEWEDVEVFYNWAKSNGYKEGLELDRINNDGNYEPSNCRFTTRSEQTRNTRRNINITINKETKTLTEWAEENNLKTGTISSRYHIGDRGLDLIRPVENKGSAKGGRPLKGEELRVTINKETKTLTEWAKIYNIKVNTLQYRYYRGDRGERLFRPVETKYNHSLKRG